MDCSGARGLFSVVKGRRSEDGGFPVDTGSSIDGQRCHAVSLVEHGGRLGNIGLSVMPSDGEWYFAGGAGKNRRCRME